MLSRFRGVVVGRRCFCFSPTFGWWLLLGERKEKGKTSALWFFLLFAFLVFLSNRLALDFFWCATNALSTKKWEFTFLQDLFFVVLEICWINRDENNQHKHTERGRGRERLKLIIDRTNFKCTTVNNSYGRREENGIQSIVFPTFLKGQRQSQEINAGNAHHSTIKYLLRYRVEELYISSTTLLKPLPSLSLSWSTRLDNFPPKNVSKVAISAYVVAVVAFRIIKVALFAILREECAETQGDNSTSGSTCFNLIPTIGPSQLSKREGRHPKDNVSTNV